MTVIGLAPCLRDMDIKLTIESHQLDKEELRHLIQSIRDCEQKYFRDKEIFIWVEVPELTEAESTEILTSIKPPYSGRRLIIFKRP